MKFTPQVDYTFLNSLLADLSRNRSSFFSLYLVTQLVIKERYLRNIIKTSLFRNLKPILEYMLNHHHNRFHTTQDVINQGAIIFNKA